MISEAVKQGTWDVSRIVATVYVKSEIDPLFMGLGGLGWAYLPDAVSLLLSAVLVVILGNRLLIPPKVTYTWSDGDRIPVPAEVHAIRHPPPERLFELKIAWQGNSLLAKMVRGILKSGRPRAQMTVSGHELQVAHEKSAPSSEALVRNIRRGIEFDLNFLDRNPSNWSNCRISVASAPLTTAVDVDYQVVVTGRFRKVVSCLVRNVPNLTTFQLDRVT